MLDQFSRTQLLLGQDVMDKLRGASVAVFGIGGVGGYTVEALARSGVGSLHLIDNDKVCLTNLNRQIIATHKTIDRDKVDVMKERVLEINPKANVTVHKCFYLPETSDEFDFSQYSYVVDAVDTVTAKIDIILKAQEHSVPVISCMGAGNRLDASKLEVTDIYKTEMCPLAKVMRRELKKRRVKSLKVISSTEKPVRPHESEESESTNRRSIPGSTSFVPAVAGLLMAGEVIRDLTKSFQLEEQAK